MGWKRAIRTVLMIVIYRVVRLCRYGPRTMPKRRKRLSHHGIQCPAIPLLPRKKKTSSLVSFLCGISVEASLHKLGWLGHHSGSPSQTLFSFHAHTLFLFLRCSQPSSIEKFKAHYVCSLQTSINPLKRNEIFSMHSSMGVVEHLHVALQQVDPQLRGL